jgi:hypothetical protein
MNFCICLKYARAENFATSGISACRNVFTITFDVVNVLKNVITVVDTTFFGVKMSVDAEVVLDV